MSASTGFRSNRAGWSIGEKLCHLAALELLSQHNLSMLIYRENLKHTICQIGASCRNLHDDAFLGSSGCSILPLWHIDTVAGGGVHPNALRRYRGRAPQDEGAGTPSADCRRGSKHGFGDGQYLRLNWTLVCPLRLPPCSRSSPVERLISRLGTNFEPPVPDALKGKLSTAEYSA